MTKLYRIGTNKKFISTLNNNTRKWGVIDRQFFTHPTQEKCTYYQVNNIFAEKDISFEKSYYNSNYCNIISREILKLKNFIKAKDHFYHLYHYLPSS